MYGVFLPLYTSYESQLRVKNFRSRANGLVGAGVASAKSTVDPNKKRPKRRYHLKT